MFIKEILLSLNSAKNKLLFMAKTCINNSRHETVDEYCVEMILIGSKVSVQGWVKVERDRLKEGMKQEIQGYAHFLC